MAGILVSWWAQHGHQFVRYDTFAANGEPIQLPDLVFTYIDASDGPSVDDLVTVAAETTLVQRPEIISRAGWGADERLRYEDQDTSEDVIWPPEYVPVAHAIIHHSVTPNKQDPSWRNPLDLLLSRHHPRLGRYRVQLSGRLPRTMSMRGATAAKTSKPVTHSSTTMAALASAPWAHSRRCRCHTRSAGRSDLDHRLGDPRPRSHERKFFIDSENVPTICGHRDVNGHRLPGRCALERSAVHSRCR